MSGLTSKGSKIQQISGRWWSSSSNDCPLLLLSSWLLLWLSPCRSLLLRRWNSSSFSVILSVLIRIQNKLFEDFNRRSLARSSSLSNGRSLLQPRPAAVVIPRGLQLLDFLVRPRAHTNRLAPMRNGLVRRLALVAHKGKELDANGAKTKLLGLSAVGTRRIARGTGQFPDAFFGGRGHIDLSRFAWQYGVWFSIQWTRRQ